MFDSTLNTPVLREMLRRVWFYLVSNRSRFPYVNAFLNKNTWKHIFEKRQIGNPSKEPFLLVEKKLTKVKWETSKEGKGFFISEWSNEQNISKGDSNFNKIV